MAKNFYKLWVVLLIISGGIALWFSGVAAVGFWTFARLDAKAAAQVSNWEIINVSSSCFALAANYRYEVQGKSHAGKTLFESPRFLNRFAAENYLKAAQTKSWETWYSSGNPAFCSLEKEFPQKQCLHALLTVGVFAYFYFCRSTLLRFVS
jgi:hypothetical protein